MNPCPTTGFGRRELVNDLRDATLNLLRPNYSQGRVIVNPDEARFMQPAARHNFVRITQII